jgi:hypothetical protein
MDSRMIFRTGALMLSGLMPVSCVSSDRAAPDAAAGPDLECPFFVFFALFCG